MNDEQVSGKLDQLKGNVKEGAGKLTGDRETEAEGLGDQLKGKIKETFGDVKEKIHDATK
jgi:uncharacterized protein YjbJ (UPF0337 family)